MILKIINYTYTKKYFKVDDHNLDLVCEAHWQEKEEGKKSSTVKVSLNVTK